MSTNKKSDYYIDTNILLYFLKTKYFGKQSDMAKRFLQKIEDGKYHGTISEFTLSELVKSLREVMVKYENIKLANDWKIEIGKALKAIYEIQNLDIKKVFTKNDGKQLLTEEIANEGINILQKYPGKVSKKDDEFEHDGLHPMDTYHIVLAKTLGCSALATFDNDFDESKTEIPTLKLQSDFW